MREHSHRNRRLALAGRVLTGFPGHLAAGLIDWVQMIAMLTWARVRERRRKR